MPQDYATTRLWAVSAPRLLAGASELAARLEAVAQDGFLQQRLREQWAARELFEEFAPAPCPVCRFPVSRAAASAAAVLLGRATGQACPVCGVALAEAPPAAFVWRAELSDEQIDQLAAAARAPTPG